MWRNIQHSISRTMYSALKSDATSKAKIALGYLASVLFPAVAAVIAGKILLTVVAFIGWARFFFGLQIPLNLIWFGLTVALSCFVWLSLTGLDRSRRTISTASFSIFFMFSPWLFHLHGEFLRQKEAWLSAKCNELNDALFARLEQAPLIVEGYLDRTDYDGLINSRFRSNASAIERRDGTTRTYDLGDYAGHAIHRLMPRTFGESAYKLLTQERLSYYELEMVKSGSNGMYSNSSFLDTKEWKGTRYRLYYLAPRDSAPCAQRLIKIENGVHHYYKGAVVNQADPFCVVMEITDKPISKYHLSAREEMRNLWWSADLLKLPIPSFVRVRMETIRLSDIETGKLLAQYEGFNYPNDVMTRHRCGGRGRLHLPTSLLPENNPRKFFHKYDWYKGSVIEHFYERHRSELLPPYVPPNPILPPASVPYIADGFKRDESMPMMPGLMTVEE